MEAVHRQEADTAVVPSTVVEQQCSKARVQTVCVGLRQHITIPLYHIREHGHQMFHVRIMCIVYLSSLFKNKYVRPRNTLATSRAAAPGESRWDLSMRLRDRDRRTDRRQTVTLRFPLDTTVVIHRVKWRHSIICSRYDLHVVGHDAIPCEVNWWKFVTLYKIESDGLR